MTITLTTDETNRLLDEVVADKGADYVYSWAATAGDCVNAERGADGKIYPSCIVGHVLHRAGVPVEDLFRFAPLGSSSLLADLEIEADAGSQSLLQVAQDHQDNGEPWGDAVAYARRRLVEDHENEED